MKRATPVHDISPERRALHYAGMVVGFLGFLTFGSLFVTAALNFGDFQDFDGQRRSSMFRAILGMVLMMAGTAMTNLAKKGLAGSGVVLDPQRARREMEPWSRMKGGMIGDVLDEIPAVSRAIDRVTSDDRPVEVVRVRCNGCRALNDESARFCSQCGASL